ncbi:tyrosine-type recombinase/integrase [Kocuria sp. UCD-OTCP]|uniref:site-specific integrase n=1 Tax=Kocuria sp. UCD-OTCP TaxID=1292021 RepID=UPI000378397F|nr:tyrosine-type recombinase/integrase [Kocuria sp. UCD-OTCP]EYT53523.1 integrase [Kocuria sp. UCD-OTCP]
MAGSVFKRCTCSTAELTDPTTGKRRVCTKAHGSWWFNVLAGSDPITGKRKQVARGGFRTKRAAEAALADLVVTINAGTWTDDNGLTVETWLNTWLDRKVRNGLRPATERLYRQHINDYLTPGLGNLRLRDLRPGHVSDLLSHLQMTPGRSGEPLSASTVTRVHACLRSALTTAVKMRLVTFNAARDVELPKVQRARVRPWEPWELGAFLDGVQGERLAALFEVIAGTGLRRGEALGLRWSDVDVPKGVVVVRQQLTERSGTEVDCPSCGAVHRGLRFAPPKTDSGDFRRVELDAGTMGALLGHRLAQDDEREHWDAAYVDHDLVFCRENGDPLRPEAVDRLFHRLTDRVLVPVDRSDPTGPKVPLRRVRLHDLRHGQASLLMAAGVDMNIVSKRLGHSRSSFTADTYAHLLEGVGRDAAERAAALVPRRSSTTTP